MSLVSASCDHPKVSLWAVAKTGEKPDDVWCGCALRDPAGAEVGPVSVAVLVLADNVDDPTGNFRSGPLTGWKVFLLLLCALLGIIICAVVGAVVFQKRQERNKRFY